MATADSVKAKIQGLIDSCNQTTGNTDTDLTAGVNALIAGFGSGGSVVNVSHRIVTAASSIGNAADIVAMLKNTADSDALFNVWAPVVEPSTIGINNAFAAFMLPVFSNSVEGVVYRYRDGAFAKTQANSGSYDVVITAGDKLHYWAIAAPKEVTE